MHTNRKDADIADISEPCAVTPSDARAPVSCDISARPLCTIPTRAWILPPKDGTLRYWVHDKKRTAFRISFEHVRFYSCPRVGVHGGPAVFVWAEVPADARLALAEVAMHAAAGLQVRGPFMRLRLWGWEGKEKREKEKDGETDGKEEGERDARAVPNAGAMSALPTEQGGAWAIEALLLRTGAVIELVATRWTAEGTAPTSPVSPRAIGRSMTASSSAFQVVTPHGSNNSF